VSHSYALPSPPSPSDPAEAARWEHTRLRRRLLDGQWKRDLEQRLQDHLGTVRRVAWGPPDLSANPYRVICRELSTLYLSPPVVRHDQAGDALAPLIGESGLIASSGLWSTMTRYQSWVIGCREYLTRVSTTTAGELRYRPVAPDMVIAESSLDAPDVPLMVRELRLRTLPGSKKRPIWTWDVLDVRDPKSPTYRVHEAGTDGGLGNDITASATRSDGQLSGDRYPYRRADGTPILPYVMHHAEHLGDRLWDPFEGLETLEGSMNLAVLLSFWLHLVKDASWPQRWGINVTPDGIEVVDDEGNARRIEIVTDPAVLLILRQVMEGVTPSVGQFQPGGDPVALLQAIESYSARLAQDAGVSGSDLQRMSADPRSGYAISLSNDGRRGSTAVHGAVPGGGPAPRCDLGGAGQPGHREQLPGERLLGRLPGDPAVAGRAAGAARACAGHDRGWADDARGRLSRAQPRADA